MPHYFLKIKALFHIYLIFRFLAVLNIYLSSCWNAWLSVDQQTTCAMITRNPWSKRDELSHLYSLCLEQCLELSLVNELTTVYLLLRLQGCYTLFKFNKCIFSMGELSLKISHMLSFSSTDAHTLYCNYFNFLLGGAYSAICIGHSTSNIGFMISSYFS